MRRQPIARGPLAVALVTAALLACGLDDGTTIDDQELRDDVVHCEEAVGHLEKCCAGFVAEKLACVHYVKTEAPGCGSADYSTEKEDPALDLAESRCILATDCDSLVRQGVCGRAQSARAQRSSTSYEEGENEDEQGTTTTTSTPHVTVCP